MKRTLLAVALAAAAGHAVHGETLAITGASVIVKPGQRIENATVVIDKGKVTAVGTAAIPQGARVIDGKGKVVTAGFIEGISMLGLIGVEGESSSADGRFGATDTVHDDPVHASFQARDGFSPHEAAIPVARASGITLAVVTPVGGLVAGQAAAFALDGSADPVRAPAAVDGAVGIDGAGALGGSRGKAIEILRELLDDARTFGKDRAAFDRNAKRKMIADRLDLEALQPVLARQVPLVVEAEAEADILAAVRLAHDLNIRVAIIGGAEAWRVAGDLAKAKISVFLDPTANLPAAIYASDVHEDAAAILDKAGVQVAISTLGGSWNARDLRSLAGNAVAHGMAWDHALAAVTTAPAAIYGLTGRGTLEVGSTADVVVWSGDPFETTTAAEHVIISGVEQSLENHQTRLLQRYRKLH